ncbi:putative transcription factor interactor and regulator AUX-IAA family [Helianthus annuus]|uniref:Auxin-responsive protein n=1 Tax=Helianthus annuus TaxID=4232 RepID=A0A251UUS4_HELAN|nr:auxin-responsive protein IAA1 [Helianthus annuus]KAF5808085.1 putative transcription factor interactor and regulator AUX-IAA family [Helianthus annuus]KAJ0586553.1 putative transcription factor interactor and regulator AUX-IAA family [Helianthus annuus]KAJ0924836.1 putative transcription factor interactor and regulator AUX-IAA family [Helianthus annuus]
MSTGSSELTTAGDGLRFDEMELTLGLPGDSHERKSGTKRTFKDMVDLKLGRFESPEIDESNCESSDFESKSPAKERVIGWPPVRSYRKNTMINNCKYVKVAVDGAPYLRKVDLKSCTSYQELLRVLEEMFSCFTIYNVLNEKKLMDHGNRLEHVPTYEDKDGDWMLVGDVPWKMFVETCTRIRLMKSSEAITQLDISNAHLLQL